MTLIMLLAGYKVTCFSVTLLVLARSVLLAAMMTTLSPGLARSATTELTYPVTHLVTRIMNQAQFFKKKDSYEIMMKIDICTCVYG